MRFRLPEWDVEMPAALVSYWAAWNADELDTVPGLLAAAVTGDVEWNDPRDSFVGIGELEAAVRRLRTSKPEYRFEVVSGLICRVDGFFGEPTPLGAGRSPAPVAREGRTP